MNFAAILSAIKSVILTLQLLVKTMEEPDPVPTSNHADKLYQTSFASIGRDVSPRDQAPDELACAESLSKVVQEALPEFRFPTFLSTKEMYLHLNKSPSWKLTKDPQPGDIIISVTGTGNGKLAHGHCGVNGKSWIMSNDSRNGIWTANYTLTAWKQYFENRGDFPTLFYRPV